MATIWKFWHLARPTSATERWALAERLAAGDAEADFVADTLRRRRIAIGLGAAAVAVLVGLGTGFLTSRGHHRRHPQHHVATWAAILGLGLTLLGIIVIGRYLVLYLRHRRPLELFRSPLFALTRTERKGVMGQVLGRRPVDPAQLQVTRVVAERLGRVNLPSGYFLGMGLIFTGTIIDADSIGRAIFTAVIAVVMFGALVSQRWYRRRSQAFLAAHPPVG